MNIHRYYKIIFLAFVSVMGVTSCASPDLFVNSIAPNAAELRIKNSGLLSSSYGSGVVLSVEAIDNKPTIGLWSGVKQPWRLPPGPHEIAVNASGSWNTYASGFFTMNFKSNSTYVLRGRTLGRVFLIELVNTTGGLERVEGTFKAMGHEKQSIYIPIVVGGG